ncbi:MAG: hypothetical protein Q8M07_00135 [Prosthecobacter sp.]|nr:hypothetical protein [Prosthecobacter sp.]
MAPEVPVAIKVLAATHSPLSVSSPFLLKSIHTFKKALEPEVLVTLTVRELLVPAITEAGSVTPSSSSVPVMSSPVAVALVVAADSTSVVAPIFRVAILVLLALPKLLKSPKSKVWACAPPAISIKKNRHPNTPKRAAARRNAETSSRDVGILMNAV